MSNPLPIEVAPAEGGWSEVRARDQIIRYRRSGAGRAVLLLHARPDTQPLSPALLQAMAAEFRLIVPSAPARDTDVDAWLSALFDGLGAPQIAVIASEEFWAPTLQRALIDPERISAIVLLCANRGSDVLSGTLGTTDLMPAVPLLLVHHDQAFGEVLPDVLRFLKLEAVIADA